jgi:hypothetical protein
MVQHCGRRSLHFSDVRASRVLDSAENYSCVKYRLVQKSGLICFHDGDRFGVDTIGCEETHVNAVSRN